MKSSGWSLEWMLGASALIFFLIGRFLAPYFESISNAATGESGNALSDGALWVGMVLGLLLGIRLIFRFKSR